MVAQARAIENATAADAPVAVVISPPWWRTGTGRIIEDQIAFYRDRGFATAFVGVPVHASHVPENPMWLELADAARELRADHASFALLRPAQSPKTLWRRARQVLDARTSLDWIVELGRCSRPAPALLDFLRKRSIAVLHINHVFTMGFASRLRRELGPSGRPLPFVVETHDIQSVVLSERAEANPWTGRPDDLESLLRAESKTLGKADILVHCSVVDQRFFTERFPGKPQLLARPAIDGAFIAAVAEAVPSQVGPIDVLLVGAGHQANVVAVKWFLTAVWPLIAERGLVVMIVGRVGDMLRQERPDLHDRFKEFFIGPVEDLAPYYSAARSVIAPMRSGGGISIKTIEAFALGKPFVGTTKAYRGLPRQPLERRGFRGYDDPRGFADAILQVLSPDDDTGARGRAIYDELCSRQAGYAIRDEAVQIARDLRAARSQPSARPKSAHGNADLRSIEMLVLGTSNCVGPSSFIEKAGAKSAVHVRNLSLGASSSMLGVYELHNVEPVRRGVAFIDYAINDNDVAWNLWGRESGAHIVTTNIGTIAARLRSMHFLPILFLCASHLDEDVPLGHALHREVCVKEQINFIDLRRMVLEAIARGASRDSLMRDDCHLSDRAGDAVAEFLAAVIRRMNATMPALVGRSTAIVPSRAVYANGLFPQSALVDRNSSQRSATYGRLVMGDVVRIPVRPTERLAGVLINTGAPGGTIALRNGETEIIKSMMLRWAPEQPDRYAAMFVDFAQPPIGGPSGITMAIADRDAVATERTIHAQPPLPGRYGEIEIEGVLLTESSTVEFGHACPHYDWMPLDLSELPEARHLSNQLAGLAAAKD